MTDDQSPMSVAELRAYADRLEREGRAQLARAQQVRDAADTIERLREMGPESGLFSRNEYGTIRDMPSTEIVAPQKKRRGPPSEGPMTDLAKELGFASMRELATALKEKDSNIRAWNHRGAPESAKEKIEKLRRERRAKAKRA